MPLYRNDVDVMFAVEEARSLLIVPCRTVPAKMASVLNMHIRSEKSLAEKI